MRRVQRLLQKVGCAQEGLLYRQGTVAKKKKEKWIRNIFSLLAENKPGLPQHLRIMAKQEGNNENEDLDKNKTGNTVSNSF